MTLRRRVLWGTLAVVAVVLLIGLIAMALAQRTVREVQREEIVRQGEATARLVEEALGAGPARTRLAVADVLRAVRTVGGHDYVEAALRGPNGGTAVLGEDNVLLAALPPAATGQRVVELTIEGSRVLATVVGVDAGDRGTILIAIGRTERLGVATTVGRTILIALAVGALAAVLLAVWLSDRLGRDLDRLSTAVRAYAAGDVSVRIDDAGEEEIAAVGRAFNDMADELAAGKRRERDFFLSVGHDLRTPLTTIRGYAEGLAAGDIAEDDLARIGGVLEGQANRLSRLVEDLMLLARVEAREFTLQPEPVDLAAHIQGIVDGYTPRAGAAGVRLDTHIETVGSHLIDADRVAQIAGNLIDNALRYTPEGGTVTVRLIPDELGARLVVADTGPGIDPEDLPHVFERLYVAQRYRAVRPEGSGLGLSIVKALADAMGADVFVSSEPGVGTTAEVRFVAG